MVIKFSLKVKLILFTILIIIAAYVLYRQSLSYFFLQDDWFHLNISKASNIHEFINFFTIRTDIIAWRPVSKQLFFFFSQVLFGLNPFWPHVIIFIIFLTNIFLIFRLIHQLFNSYRIAAVTSFLYGTSAIHFTPLSWLSAGEYVIGTLFWLLCVSSYLFFKKERRVSTYLLFLLYFILCLASTEFALTIPLVILGYELLTKNHKTKNRQFYTNFISTIKFLVPIIIIVLVYVVLRTIVYPVPVKDDYGLSINLRTVNTYIWYGLWSLNVPEIFKYQLILSKFTFSKEPAFLFHFNNYSMRFFILFSLGLLTLTYIFFINLKRKTINILLISILFFSITISPVLFLPKHTFPHYLTIPSIGIYTFIAYLLSSLKYQYKLNMVVLIVFIAAWFASSFNALSFTRETHWIPSEQSISKNLTKKIQKIYPYLLRYSSFLVYDSDLKIKQALMDQYALQAIFNDKTLKTIYTNDINLDFTTNNYLINMNQKNENNL